MAGPRARGVVFVLAIAALAGAAWVTSAVAVDARAVLLGGHFIADPMGTVLKLFAYGAAAVTLLYSRDYLERRDLLKGEYLVLALFAVLGIQVIVSAGSLLIALPRHRDHVARRSTRWSRSTATTGSRRSPR